MGSSTYMLDTIVWYTFDLMTRCLCQSRTTFYIFWWGWPVVHSSQNTNRRFTLIPSSIIVTLFLDPVRLSATKYICVPSPIAGGAIIYSSSCYIYSGRLIMLTSSTGKVGPAFRISCPRPITERRERWKKKAKKDGKERMTNGGVIAWRRW